MNVVCVNEVFKLHGLADEPICVVLEDINLMCAFLGLRRSGSHVGFLSPARMRRKGRTAEGRSLLKE